MFLHQIFLLLGHRFADHVRFPRLIARQIGGNLDNLLLIDGDPVGITQNRFQIGVVELHRLLPVHPANITGNLLHWPRPIQRNSGHNMVKTARPHVGHQPFHTCPFHLEHTGHAPLCQHLKQLLRLLRRVWPHMPGVVGDVIHGVAHPIPLFNQPGGAAHDRQRTQPQKVHFQQANRFHNFHRPLRYAIQAAQPFLAAGGAVEGHVFLQRPIGNDHPGRMAGGMACHSLQTAGRIQQLFYRLLPFVPLL